MIKRKKIERFLFFILIVLYIVILEYAYKNIIKDPGSSVFPMQERNGLPIVISWLLALLPFWILDFKKKTLSNFVVGLFYFISYIPGCVLMEYVSDRIQYWFLYFGYWMFLFILNKVFPYSKKVFTTERMGHKFNGILVVFLACVIVVIWSGYANARMYLSLDDIYAARREARQFQLPMVLRYCFSAAKALVPIIIIVSLSKKKWKTGTILSVVGMMVYLIEGSKFSLFSIFLAWGIWGGCYVFTEKKIWLYIIGALDSLGMISIIAKTSIPRIFSYFFRRMIFMPPTINVFYYDFFKNSEKVFFRQSIIGKLIGEVSPYNVSIAHLIGKFEFNNIETNANTGVVGDAYANLGAIGIVVMPVLIIILLRMIEICIKGLDFRIYLFVGVTLMLYLVSVSFFTLFLSNGILIISFYLLLVGRQNDEKVYSNDIGDI